MRRIAEQIIRSGIQIIKPTNYDYMAENSTLKEQIEALRPWFHNIHLPDGSQTAPDHTLGDFPAFKWKKIEPYIPENLTGKTVLDVGCNAGFYSLKLAQRGARVRAIDLDPHYLEQARWTVSQYGLSEYISLEQKQVYDLAHEDRQYDIIWFMGVFYHLRYPLLALDILSRKAGEMLVFQTLTMPGKDTYEVQENYSFDDRNQMLGNEWPKMAFIESSFNGDPTNWWAANPACIESMLRTCGFKIRAKPGPELCICEPDPARTGVSQSWNESEYLSAIGRDWMATHLKKVT